MGQYAEEKKRHDRKRYSRRKNKTGDSKVASNEIPDTGDTSDIPGLPPRKTDRRRSVFRWMHERKGIWDCLRPNSCDRDVQSTPAVAACFESAQIGLKAEPHEAL